jgi:hypothetical protein
MNDASKNPSPARGVSMTTLILTAALTAATAAAVVLAALYFVGGARKPGVQKDVVKPQGHPTGEVFYPLPYAAPPHLTLTAPHRTYSIVKQDEYGFTWSFDYLLEDFAGDQKDLKSALANLTFGIAHVKPDIQYEDFTWEATGVPAGADATLQRSFEQTGSFQSVLGTQGQENFAVPYSSPPQVTLTGHNGTTVTVETTNTGFNWKNSGKDNPFPGNNEGTVTWTAKGVRETKLTK